MIPADFDERWYAYTVTVVRFDHPERGPHVLSPDPAGNLDEFLAQPEEVIHVMTAHNPGRQLSASENDARQQQLRNHLTEQSDLQIWTALGADPTWTHSEDSVAIIGLKDDEARDLAASFDQDAIFAWTASSWGLLSCRDDRSWYAGWTLKPVTTST